MNEQNPGLFSQGTVFVCGPYRCCRFSLTFSSFVCFPSVFGWPNDAPDPLGLPSRTPGRPGPKMAILGTGFGL